MAKEAVKRYWATRGFTYGAQELDRGQITTLIGAPNDPKLVRLAYFKEVESRDETYQCGKCGAEFADMGSRTAHGAKRHRNRELNPYEEDEMIEREAKLANELSPLDLTATAASRR